MRHLWRGSSLGSCCSRPEDSVEGAPALFTPTQLLRHLDYACNKILCDVRHCISKHRYPSQTGSAELLEWFKVADLPICIISLTYKSDWTRTILALTKSTIQINSTLGLISIWKLYLSMWWRWQGEGWYGCGICAYVRVPQLQTTIGKWQTRLSGGKMKHCWFPNSIH